MKKLTIKSIADVCDGKLLGIDEETQNPLIDIEVSGIVTDNRKVTEKSVFVAIKGNRVDGHSFIEDAFAKGAIGVISEKELDMERPYILVRDSLAAIKKIAKFYRENLDIKVVGVTGSVGKTSTKEIIHAVLSEKYNTLKTEGNFNNELGLPLTVFRLREEHEIAVLEMGISNFGEMTRLSEIAKPDVAVITNIGLCHLENLGSRDGILKAKTEMFKNIKDDATIILNGDDDKLITINEYNGIKPVFYGMNNTGLPVFADNVAPKGIKGIACDLHYGEDIISVMINIPGIHMVYNALAALCVGKSFGLSNEEIKRGIEKLKPVQGRNNIIETEKYTVIDDCYNANPVSMKASIDVLEFADTRKVAILGDMFELGVNEEKLHQGIGQYLCDKNIDVIIFIGKLMKNAYDALDNSREKYYFENIEDFIEKKSGIINEKDTILVKASHGMNFVKIIEVLKLV